MMLLALNSFQAHLVLGSQLEGSSLKMTIFPTQPSIVACSFLSRVWIPVGLLC